MGLGLTSVDEQRFPRSLDGWASPDYESAANRVDIDLQGGAGLDHRNVTLPEVPLGRLGSRPPAETRAPR